MLWLGVHFPSLPLEVFTATANLDDSQPVVVTERSRVLLRNPAAIAAGIMPGCTLATAHGIEPRLRHFQRCPEHERARLTLVAEALYGFSARVYLSPGAAQLPSDAVALEIGASLRLFGEAEALARRVVELCGALGHEVRVRLARTPLAAWILARADTDDLDQASLDAAAVEPARLPPDRIERLANMGIHSLGQLNALPRRELAHRLGDDLLDFLDRITGTRPDPRPTVEPAERFQASLHLPEPVKDKQTLMFPIQRLLTDLQHWLISRQLGAEQLRWHFSGYASSGDTGASIDSGRICMSVRLARARQRREAFIDVTRLRLEAATLPEEVLDITLEAPRLIDWCASSQELFQTLSPGSETLDDAGELVDQLRARLGGDACHGLETVDRHTPEAAWRPAPPLGRRLTHGAAADGSPPRRPLWLFEPPRPIDPAGLTLLRGPERIHTGWWSEPPSRPGGLLVGAASRPRSDTTGEARPGGRSHGETPQGVGAASRPRSDTTGESRPGGRSHGETPQGVGAASRPRSDTTGESRPGGRSHGEIRQGVEAASRPRSDTTGESRPGEHAFTLRAPSRTSIGRPQGDRGRGQARDYYVARHANGAECWVFVDPWDRWFLHGYFA